MFKKLDNVGGLETGFRWDVSRRGLTALKGLLADGVEVESVVELLMKDSMRLWLLRNDHQPDFYCYEFEHQEDIPDRVHQYIIVASPKELA